MPRPQRLPPSAGRVFVLSLLVLTAVGAYRWFYARLLPDTAVFNIPPQNLAVIAGTLPCALFFYWLARLRYRGRTVANAPGTWGASLTVTLGLVAAASWQQWHRLVADFDSKTAVLRLAGTAAVLGASACEECGFRGSLFLAAQEIAGRYGSALALTCGCLGFVLVHACFQSLWSLPFAAAAGLALGLARLRGVSLWTLIAAHALMDGTEVFWLSPTLSLGYWPGIEAAAVTCLTIAVLWLLPKAEQPSLVAI